MAALRARRRRRREKPASTSGSEEESQESKTGEGQKEESQMILTDAWKLVISRPFEGEISSFLQVAKVLKLSVAARQPGSHRQGG
jgi:hypothetical protein